MSAGSLRLRLLTVAAVSIAAALGIAGFGVYLLMERYIERRVEGELHSHLLQLAANIQTGADGTIKVAKPLADPRFSQPLSGLYWQIDSNGQPIARSRSLWDERLEVPTPPNNAAEVHTHLVKGPNGIELFSREQLAVFEIGGKELPLVLTVGLDRAEIDATVSAFRSDLLLGLLVLGLVLTAGAWLQVNVGLRPLQALRERLERVRAGTASRLDGSFPNEVRPLVMELNTLLEARDQELLRARQRAGDLAHGLLTPVTVLSGIARRMADTGHQIEAREIRLQTDHMQRHVERELARARLASGHSAKPTQVKPVVDRLIDTIRRAPGADSLVWRIDVPDEATMAIERGDLMELLGNILDNSRKWARSNVHVAFNDNCLVIEDDGPGIAEKDLDLVLERGAKLDEASPGSGLGLAIVRDITELYGIGLTLNRSSLGGLETRVEARRA
jgi:signal transduction histidine kinase